MQVAVIGAGPVGLETAVALEDAGHEVVVLEAGRVGDAVRRWGHVTLFTPWEMNTTVAGRERVGLRAHGCPTGAELVADYLEPLAATLDVRPGHRVVSVSRPGLTKGQQLGSMARTASPFRLLVQTPDGEQARTAEVVVDCSGVFGDPVPAGPGGSPALEERAAASAGRVRYGPVQVPAEDASVLIIGDGASATTVLTELLEREVDITWLTRSQQGPGFVSPEDDPLPLRHTLYTRTRDAVATGRVTHLTGVEVERIRTDGTVHFSDGRTLRVDRVVAACGLRPDHGLSRELQVHVCWGSEGPMKLAAALLSQSGGGGDCLDQAPLGAEALRSPEPRFFVLGAKSYGRRSDFLLQVGHGQIQELLTLL